MQSPTSAHRAGPDRRHDIDALRVIAFGLLILYHIGMFYVPWNWHVKSVHLAAWLEPVMLLVNQWRMPLVFMVSGLALNFLRRRVGDGRLAAQRTLRLGLPLLVGMLVVIPPQAYFEALSHGATAPGYLQFLARYFTFQPWPQDAFAGSDIGVTWNHLWYLPYLLVYTLALIPLARWLNQGRGARLRRRLQNLRGLALVLLPILPLLASGLLVFPHFPYQSHALLDDWYAHSQYFTFFLYGYLIGTDDGLWREFARLRRVALAAGILSFACLLSLFAILPEDVDGQTLLLQLVVTYFNRWIWLVAALGLAHALLNRPFGWLGYANEAVYPWYVLHQTLIVVAGYWLSTLALGPVAEPLLLIACTLGGCALLHEFVIRRSRMMRPLFGMKPAARAADGPARIARGGQPCPRPISAGSSD